jgi:hypothetical protein
MLGDPSHPVVAYLNGLASSSQRPKLAALARSTAAALSFAAISTQFARVVTDRSERGASGASLKVGKVGCCEIQRLAP